MLIKMSEFLKLLPPKKCLHCGKSVEEQHEFYNHLCVTCLEKNS